MKHFIKSVLPAIVVQTPFTAWAYTVQDTPIIASIIFAVGMAIATAVAVWKLKSR